MASLPKTVTLELSPEDLAGFVNDLSVASNLPTRRERRAAVLAAIGDMVDVATPLAAILPPPFGVLVDDVLDIDGKLYDVVVAEAGKAWDAARDAFNDWRAKKGERQAMRSTNRRRKDAKKTAAAKKKADAAAKRKAAAAKKKADAAAKRKAAADKKKK